jgi:DNA-binding CsgD family transcriptional regulator
LGLARSAGIPTLEVMPRYLLVMTGFLAGDWDGVWRETTELLALAYRVGSLRGVAAGLLGRAMVLSSRGQLPEAAACLAEARSVFGGASPVDQHLFVTLDAVNVQIALERGDPSTALAAAGTLATSWPAMPFHLAVLGEAQVAAGELDLALGTAAQVAALGPGAPYPAALAARLVGLVHHRRGDRAGALEALARAADGFTLLAIPFEAARCRLEWALAAAPERPDEATAAAQQSLTIFSGLGARRFADQARRLLRDLGARPAPARRAGGRVVGLSGREAEVVRLVAEGLSNADIARRLVISPRTVTTHLQHVYARLGLGSRAALVRYAVEHDLLGGADT